MPKPSGRTPERIALGLELERVGDFGKRGPGGVPVDPELRKVYYIRNRMKTEAEKRRAAFLLHLTEAEKGAFEAAAGKEGKKVAVWARDCLRVVVGLDAPILSPAEVAAAEGLKKALDVVHKDSDIPLPTAVKQTLDELHLIKHAQAMPPKIAEASGIPPIPIKDDGGPLAEVAPKTVIPAPAPAQPKRIFVDNGRPKGK